MTEIPSPLPTAVVVSNTITINKHKSWAAGLVAVIFSIILLVIIGALLQYLQVISLPFLAKSQDVLASAAVDDFSAYFSQNLPYYEVPTKETIKKSIHIADKTTILFNSNVQNTQSLGAALRYFPNTTNLKSIFLVQQTQKEQISGPLDASQSAKLFKKYFSAQPGENPWICTVQANASFCNKRVKTGLGTHMFTFEYSSSTESNFVLLYSCFASTVTTATSCLDQSFVKF